jgi:hypothetical protein
MPTPKIRQMLEGLALGYEHLFFENAALRAILAARNDSSWLRDYALLMRDVRLKAEIHAQFLALYDQISAVTEEMVPSELLAKIPPTPESD